MSLSADLREFIGLLDSHRVDYIIVGAHSLAFHARPRYTGDLEIFLRPSPENAAKILRLLRGFGFEKLDLTQADFTKPGQVIQLGRPPNQIDLLTSLSGVATDAAFDTKIGVELDGLPVWILNRDLLIQNKRAVGRAQDLADLESLGES